MEADMVEIEDKVPAAGTTVPVGGATTWIARRRPVALTVAIIVIVTIAGWGLRRWGPLNPEVRVTSYTQELGLEHPLVALTVQNEAIAPIEVTGLSLEADPVNTNGGVLPDIASTAGSLGSLTGTGRDLPLVVPGGDQATVSAQLATPGCRPGQPVQPFRVVIHLRTQAGRLMDVSDPSTPTRGSCGSELPTGTPPADPAAATAAVTAAYRTVYDSTAPALTKGRLIDDPHGLDVVTGSARGTSADAISTTRATVSQVSFDQPDHAWVRYDLTGPSVLVDLHGSIGEAVLRNGTWKVTRSTVCKDLALASLICPP